MKIFKRDSELERKVQLVEHFMNQLGLSIEHGHNGLEIEYQGFHRPLVDSESGEGAVSFPRLTDSVRIIKQ